MSQCPILHQSESRTLPDFKALIDQLQSNLKLNQITSSEDSNKYRVVVFSSEGTFADSIRALSILRHFQTVTPSFLQNCTLSALCGSEEQISEVIDQVSCGSREGVEAETIQ